MSEVVSVFLNFYQFFLVFFLSTNIFVFELGGSNVYSYFLILVRLSSRCPPFTTSAIPSWECCGADLIHHMCHYYDFFGTQALVMSAPLMDVNFN